MDLLSYNMLPDGVTLEYNEYSDDNDTGKMFAIFDVDCDGKEELMLTVTDGTTAGSGGCVYGFNPNTGELIQELSEYSSYHCYSNGVVTVDWSHNQGLGASIWPYNLYTYDTEKDIYVYQGCVDTWDKSSREMDYDNNPFPDNVDKDGDGIIYYITDSQGNGRDIPKDNADYEAWIQSYIGNATEIDIPWQELQYEMIDDYHMENLDMFLQQYKEQNYGFGTDIGYLLMESETPENTIVEIENLLESSYGVQMDRVMVGDTDSVFEVHGTLDGVGVYDCYKAGPAQVNYAGKQIGDVTICGIYPGMSEEEAIQILLDAGFYYRDYSYCTGAGNGNYAISIRAEKGLVTGINIIEIIRY